MDDYELQQELETLAGNAFNSDGDKEVAARPEPIATTMNRWQQLFRLSSDDAIDRIMDHRNNLTRTRISDDHWNMVQSEREAAGYDREAYEYELGLHKKNATLPGLLPAENNATESNITYLLELTGPLTSAEKVQGAVGLPDLPLVVNGYSAEDGRDVSLCCIDSESKTAILKWASTEAVGFEPTILVDPRCLRQ